MKRKVTSGKEGLVGMIGFAKTKISPEGIVYVNNEDWKAYTEEEEIFEKEKIEVIASDGLKLKVRKYRKEGE
jgi:membrane-bound ClpP family serine protease